MGTRSFPLRPAIRLARRGSLILLGALLAGCTGRGGGWLPPDGIVFSEQATLGFSFSCERSAASYNLNPPAGQMRLQLGYADHGTNPLGGPFSIHGVADEIDPVLESMICIGQEPPPDGYPLVFFGSYRPTSPPPSGLPAPCAMNNSGSTSTEAQAQAACRFEVTVQDNDGNRSPSEGDAFSIKLSTVTDPLIAQFDSSTVIYARSGLLGGGNLEVD